MVGNHILSKGLVIGIILICVEICFAPSIAQDTKKPLSTSNEKEIYTVPTDDGFSIKLIRYIGNKRPSLMLVTGVCCNHYFFD
jgi:hypothetical protein